MKSSTTSTSTTMKSSIIIAIISIIVLLSVSCDASNIYRRIKQRVRGPIHPTDSCTFTFNECNTAASNEADVFDACKKAMKAKMSTLPAKDIEQTCYAGLRDLCVGAKIPDAKCIINAVDVDQKTGAVPARLKCSTLLSYKPENCKLEAAAQTSAAISPPKKNQN